MCLPFFECEKLIKRLNEAWSFTLSSREIHVKMVCVLFTRISCDIKVICLWGTIPCENWIDNGDKT